MMTGYLPWVERRAEELEALHGSQKAAICALIAAHEEAPVDPLLTEARAFAAAHWREEYGPTDTHAIEIENGDADEYSGVQMAMAALKRGIELGRQS